MNVHAEPSAELRADAADYVMKTLTGVERSTYERHLGECAVCRGEVDGLRDVTARLEDQRADVPTDSLWRRIAERTGQMPRGGPVFAHDLPEAWVDGPLPGTRVRHLYTDEANDRVSYLVRAEPGSAFPAHEHHGPEECLVLEGELWSGNVRMPAGDYQYAEAGSHHEPQTSPKGCLLLLVSSRQDALISA